MTAALSAVGFSGAALLALFRKGVTARVRSCLVAVAAGILLSLSFGDLFPEALETAGRGAITGFVGGFALLFLAEALTRAHTHHSPEEHVREHALGLFALGLAIHNLADGFVLGVRANLSSLAGGAVGLGVLLHQVPVGVSLAAVLAATQASRAAVLWTALPLGLAIPLAAGVTAALPVPGGQLSGVLTGIAGGVLAYIGSAHLLPEA